MSGSAAAGGRRVVADEVELCVRLLDQRMAELQAEQAADPSLRVHFGPVHRQVAERAAEAAGRAHDVEHLHLVVRLIAAGEVGDRLEVVECRSTSCPAARVGVLDYRGTSCQDCGEPRPWVLGPIADRPCPAWCAQHLVERADQLIHATPLVEGPLVSMWLELAWSWDEREGGLIVEPAQLVIQGEDGDVRTPATAEVLRDVWDGAQRARDVLR